MDGLEASLPDDLRLDPFGLLAGRGLDRIPGWSFQEAVRLGWESVGQFLEIVRGGHPEDEADVTGVVPAIEVGALSEFGVAPQEDLVEASPATEANRLVEVELGPLLRGPVAAAIDQVKRLSGVGQRDDRG